MSNQLSNCCKTILYVKKNKKDNDICSAFQKSNIKVHLSTLIELFIEDVIKFKPDLVIIGLAVEETDLIQLLKNVYIYEPNIAVIILSDKKNLPDLMKAHKNILAIVNNTEDPDFVVKEVEKLISISKSPNIDNYTYSTNNDNLINLSNKYKKTLKQKKNKLEELWYDAHHNHNLETLIVEIHKIAGSAGIYGFEEISNHACDLEQLLNKCDQTLERVTLTLNSNQNNFDGLLNLLDDIK